VFGAVAALVLGADVVKTEGLDFSLLDPKPFAIASFVLLPGIAAFTIAVVLERLLVVEPWSRRSLTVVLALATLVLNVFLVVIAVVAGAAVALRRMPLVARAVNGIGRITVPIALAMLATLAGIDLWRDATEIL